MSYRLVLAASLLSASAAIAEPLAGTVADPALRRKVDVVYVEKADGEFKPPAEPAVVGQKGNTYQPHFQTILVGTKVVFQSQDPELHNVFARNGKAVLFNNAVLPQGKFEKTFPKTGAIHLTCNIHKEMSAYVFVAQNPYYATIDRSTGAFSIKNVPPGKYTLRVWGEALSDEQNAKAWPVTVEKNAQPVKIAQR